MRSASVSGAMVALLFILVACGPLGSSDGTEVSATPSPTGRESATLPLMQIATRTPVDPAKIPATPAGTVSAIEVPPSYVVQEGDSLYAIAIRFDLDLAEIVAVNGLSDPNDISVGQELILPPPPEE